MVRSDPPQPIASALLVSMAVGCLLFPTTLAAEIERSLTAKVDPPKQTITPPVGAPQPAALPDSAETDFFREKVWPIFESNCLACHGPEKQKNGLRVDHRESLLRGGDNGPAIVPGDGDGSYLIRVISGQEEDLQMPPKGDPLSTEEIEVLRSWVNLGAPFPEEAEKEGIGGKKQSSHWAFQPIRDPEPPSVQDAGWVRNPIDSFVLASLEAKGIAPSPQADPHTLLRRLYLDLIGLPPTPEEVEQFVSDTSPHAYDRLVNRLLSSPHFGERWGRHWLDTARYADSDGFEKDLPRPHAFRYRDWVIDALNRDLPYDRFVVDQVAGDLLPGGGIEEKIATGFHRNTLTNKEGGADPEEDRVNQTIDRTNTTCTVFLGLTMACAQCHNHKFDPIAQTEYYGLYGFFNTALEKNIPAPVEGEVESYRKAKKKFDTEHARLLAEVEEYKPTLESKLAEWERAQPFADVRWEVLEPVGAVSLGGAKFRNLGDGSLLVGGFSPEVDTFEVVYNTELAGITAFRLEALTDPLLPRGGPGRADHGNFILSEFTIQAGPTGNPNLAKPVEISSARADHSEKGWEIEKAIDGKTGTGWSVEAFKEGGNVDRKALFLTQEEIANEEGTTFVVKMDFQYGSGHELGRFRLLAGSGNPEKLDVPPQIPGILSVSPENRSSHQKEALLAYFGTVEPTMRARLAEVEGHLLASPKEPDTQAQTLARNPEPVTTTVLIRGDFLQPGEVVTPHTPAILPALRVRGETPDRIDLAQWIASPENPLTARVAVNRIWLHLFGRGLVDTTEDFGTQGEAPSHPELLDWLASEFIAHGWSQKEAIRTMVTSSTYRQSSKVREELTDLDPKNLWLARQNRFRVEAEIVRDLALAASGLLNPAIGGPSIRPPLPEGVAELGYAGSVKWNEDTDENRYRRGLYIFFQRTVPYPMLMAFDCPDSNVTCVRRNTSNTPLQALTLMNGRVALECAQRLGERLFSHPGKDLSDRIREAYLTCLSRHPEEAELAAMESLLKDQTEIFSTSPEAVQPLLASLDLSGTPAPEAAAWVEMGRVLLNLDEFMTRE